MELVHIPSEGCFFPSVRCFFRTRLNVVNKYHISGRSGPLPLRTRVNVVPHFPSVRCFFRTRVNVVNKYHTSGTMCFPYEVEMVNKYHTSGRSGPFPLRTSVNVVNKYHTSGRSGPHCPLMEGRCGLPRSCG